MNKYLIILSVFIPFLAQAKGKNPPPPGPPPPPGLPINQYEIILLIIGIIIFFVYRNKLKKSV
jgi:hypothetical protein